MDRRNIARARFLPALAGCRKTFRERLGKPFRGVAARRFTPRARGARDGEAFFPENRRVPRAEREGRARAFRTSSRRATWRLATRDSPVSFGRGVRSGGHAAGVPPSRSGRGGGDGARRICFAVCEKCDGARRRRAPRRRGARGGGGGGGGGGFGGARGGRRARRRRRRRRRRRVESRRGFLRRRFEPRNNFFADDGRDDGSKNVARRRGVVRARRRRALRVAVRRRARVRFGRVIFRMGKYTRDRYRRDAPESRKADVFLRRRLRRVPVRRRAAPGRREVRARSNRPRVGECRRRVRARRAARRARARADRPRVRRTGKNWTDSRRGLFL